MAEKRKKRGVVDGRRNVVKQPGHTSEANPHLRSAPLTVACSTRKCSEMQYKPIPSRRVNNTIKSITVDVLNADNVGFPRWGTKVLESIVTADSTR